MELKNVRVKYFKNIIDSGEVEVDNMVTCLVGKNESGKTAFLEALHCLNPSHDNVQFSVSDNYPAWREKIDKLKGKDIEAEKPIFAVFSLAKEELCLIEDKFGKGCIINPSEIAISRNYNGDLEIGLVVAEEIFVNHIIGLIEWSRGTKTEANKIKKINDLRLYGENLKTQKDEPEQSATGQSILDVLQEYVGKDDSCWNAIWNEVKMFFPKFLYFSEYSTLPYSVDIKHILTASPDQLKESERTAQSLLRLAAADNAYLQNPDYERRKRELENIANAITSDVMQYWSQNTSLRVHPDITYKIEPNSRGNNVVLDELKIRIWDDRHLLSLPFSEHSTGFQWFFSFLSAFAKYEHTTEPLILLLDEPALGLHARAQGDFLRFINERLAPKRQVIYTTHSPFMVQPGKLSQVRLVEDKGRDLGAVVSADVTSTDPDTLFPLQGALGYDLVQHLFIAPHNLVVEGTSDFTYLQIISDHLKSLSRISLDERWSIIPVGGADLIPTFIALLGNHLDITVIVDAKKGGHQKLNRMVNTGLLSKKKIITIGEILSKTDADIEDLFTKEDYLSIFNNAMGTSHSANEITGTEPIVRQLARLQKIERFDHGTPADFLLRNRDTILSSLTDVTLDRFEQLFERVNSTLPQNS